MTYERKPLTGLVGTVGRDPEIKDYSKGKLTKFSVAVSDGFGEEAKTEWYSAAVFNDGLQEQVQSQVYKGAQVAIQGVVTQRDGYQPDVNVVRIGLITWLSRSKAQAPQPQPQPAEEDVDF